VRDIPDCSITDIRATVRQLTAVEFHVRFCLAT
jgi:hypothetical protein